MVTKHEVLQGHLKKWLACSGNKKKRGEIVKELSKSLSMHKKSIGRSMRRLQLRDGATPERRGRSIYYGKDVDSALSKIWEEVEYSCAENIHSVLKDYVGYFIKEKNWGFGDETTSKLYAMSIGTLKLRIKAFRKKKGLGRGRSATISSQLKGMIPIRKSHTWFGLPPGYLQTDSVVHCGDLLTGDVVYSVGMVDFATYWSEYDAQWNKGKEITLESLKVIRERLPFPLLEFHPDTGNEFINYHVHDWAVKEKIDMTRSEPYKKNDNMCIEERNNSIARKHLGYVRMDDESLVPTAREILRVTCLLSNHFHPVRRLISKERIGASWKRKFEKVAKTPYERILEHKKVSREDKEKLRKVHAKLNPLELKRELDILKIKLGREIEKIKKIKKIKKNRTTR